LKGIKDVDVILLLDIDHTITEPEVLLAWVQASVQKKYPNTIVQGRSVYVTTGDGFDLDIVPAVPISHRAGAVRIPDREVKQWVATNPKGQLEFSVNKNSATEGFYKPIVKLMKHWRDRLPLKSARVKSYILESLVAGSLSTVPESYGHAIVDVFSSISSTYSIYLALGSVPRIADPGYSTVNVAKRWKFDEFKAFMQQLNEAAATANTALKEQDEGASVKAWRTLFGQEFAIND
jgi:hypothetical protein